MARFALVFTICATALFAGVHGQEVDKGVEVGTKAMQAVCWYEYLKIKPNKNPKADKFNGCFVNGALKNTMDQYAAQGITSKDYTTIKHNVGNNMNPMIKQFAPAQYSECSEYLDDPDKDYPADYSHILGDSGSYPFKGWAHCLVGQAEKTHGKEAITAMKEKMSAQPHPWINEVYNRENENRARHGSPAMKLNNELSKRAQKWADQLAEKCGELTVEDHLPKTHPDGDYEGQRMGENIAAQPVNEKYPMSPEDQALWSANAWYEEIRDYPWPEYKGKGDDATFLKIGHFTSSVWKGVQQVGYGLGKRDGCKTTYIVGRYWPSGNVVGSFGQNVLPPKE